MKTLGNKLRARGGFSLTELLAAIIVLALISLSVGAGVPIALSTYRGGVAHAEAGVLSSTLAAAVADELRYAVDVQVQDDDTVTFTSALYGAGASFGVDTDGHVTIAGQPLIGASTYSVGLTAALDIAYADGVFAVDLEILEGTANRKSVSFAIEPINQAT